MKDENSKSEIIKLFLFILNFLHFSSLSSQFSASLYINMKSASFSEGGFSSEMSNFLICINGCFDEQKEIEWRKNLIGK